MKFKTWVSIITLVLLIGVIYFARDELIQAWQLLGQVNLGILFWMIPVQIFSYYATGAIIFSYLRAKGNVKHLTHWQMTRIALELNFVNHILPSGGAVGFSYLGWLLSKHGVKPGRATMAQIVRFAFTFISFVMLLIIAVIVVAFDGAMNALVWLLSAGLVLSAAFASIATLYIIKSERRLKKFAHWVAGIGNKVVRIVSRKKRKEIIAYETIERFLEELHQDYLELRKEKKILIVPYIWATIANIADVALLCIAFLSLGVWANPAMILIAFGISSIVSALTVTPGGAGVYEAIMIAFLASAGVNPEVAILGTLLARVLLIMGTIVFGYIFYQLTILKYGKRPA
ncbi:MAG TPA: lysylphosphatidylglycerol synthase transmembrane domain-containing protein [Verrucomicrobiae bacterium]|nr:lysylphosphatidylglycerol synthase transmembrane domain-containing protein [Verrucomicrobiae bacterium]